MRTHSRMKTRVGAMLAVFGLAAAPSVLADEYDCPRVTVYNHTDFDATVSWRGWGCTGDCELKVVGPQDTTGNSYDWGTTKHNVMVTAASRKLDSITYRYSGKYFVQRQHSANAGCGEGYTIVFDGGQDTPDEVGYVFIPGTGRCVNAMDEHFDNGTPLWIWDNCVDGQPQKNRVWQWNEDTGTIVSVYDKNYCFRLTQTSEPVDGDPIRLWRCTDGSGPNKSWDYQEWP